MIESRTAGHTCRCGHMLAQHRVTASGDVCTWCVCPQFVEATDYTHIRVLASTWRRS